MIVHLCTAESMGLAPACWNCDDSSWHHRGEQPILDERDRPFCSTECLDEFVSRAEADWVRRNVRCSGCGNLRWLDGCLCEELLQSTDGAS